MSCLIVQRDIEEDKFNCLIFEINVKEVRRLPLSQTTS